MTMVDEAAATAEQRPTTGRWLKPSGWGGRQDGNSGGIMLAGAGLVATLAVVFVLWWASAQHSQVEVPNLVGMPRVQAEALLNGMGLKVRATYDEVADKPAGTVLRTDPPGGQALDQGGGVSLMLASAPVTVAPSSVVETPPVQESPAVQEAPPAQQPPPAAVPPPIVAPPPAVVPPPVVVQPPPPVVVQPPPPVVVSPPPPAPAFQPVPDVIGFDRYRAARTLADSGLKVGSVIEVESSARPWTVVRTNPGAGVAVRPGSTVDLVVAKHIHVVVPSVVGLDRAKAERALAKVGLRVGSVTEVESTQQASTVLRTDPEAGTEVAYGSAVDLVIAKPATSKPSATSEPPVPGKSPTTGKSATTGKPPVTSEPQQASPDVKGREPSTNDG